MQCVAMQFEKIHKLLSSANLCGDLLYIFHAVFFVIHDIVTSCSVLQRSVVLRAISNGERTADVSN